MSHFKSFMLGVGVSFAVYYLTKKAPDGRSVLDDILDNPGDFAQRAKYQVISDVVETVKEKIS
ncbi:YtxH domain-containing protein [Mucilaginibacter sp. UYCu711]|uniref:YtxH domain-containing protein n=1 Tax=Mucilaginibacter sp. UYCu711 TaxID=3156339 RepID=UPI003D2199E6